VIWQAEERWPARPGKELIEPPAATRNCPGLFVALRGVCAHPHQCGDDEPGAAQAAWPPMGPTGATEGRLGMTGARGPAGSREIAASDRASASVVAGSQFLQPANPRSPRHAPARKSGRHEGTVGLCCGGRGTGRQITGVSRYLKTTLGQPLVSWRSNGEQPGDQPSMQGQPLVPGPHKKSRGIGARFRTRITLALSLVDRVEAVSNEEARGDGRRPDA